MDVQSPWWMVLLGRGRSGRSRLDVMAADHRTGVIAADYRADALAADYRAPARDYLGWLSPSVSWLIAAASFVLMMVTGMLAAWGTPAEPVPPIHRNGLAPLQQQANALHVLAKAYERLGVIDLATRDTTALLGLYSFARSARRDSSAISTLLVRHGHPRMVDPMGTPPAPPISELPGVRAVPALAGAVIRQERVVSLLAATLAEWNEFPADVQVGLRDIVERSTLRQVQIDTWRKRQQLPLTVRDAVAGSQG